MEFIYFGVNTDALFGAYPYQLILSRYRVVRPYV